MEAAIFAPAGGLGRLEASLAAFFASCFAFRADILFG